MLMHNWSGQLEQAIGAGPMPCQHLRRLHIMAALGINS